jgi:hypothetical protein
VTVLTADRQSCDEVMEDEVVQDDHTWAASQRVDDPAVRFRVVPDVVQRNVRRDRARSPAPHDLDVE